jgi:hypothetical protein
VIIIEKTKANLAEEAVRMRVDLLSIADVTSTVSDAAYLRGLADGIEAFYRLVDHRIPWSLGECDCKNQKPVTPAG